MSATVDAIGLGAAKSLQLVGIALAPSAVGAIGGFMDHADIAAMHGHGWAVGAWTVLVAATILGLATERTLQLIRADFPASASATSPAMSIAASSSEVTAARHDELALVDVPKRVVTVAKRATRTSGVMVAGVKQQSAPAKHSGRIREGLNSAKGLLAGLALLGAVQPHGH
jgi:hypothetical protein